MLFYITSDDQLKVWTLIYFHLFFETYIIKTKFHMNFP
jgi:hypothetical protein